MDGHIEQEYGHLWRSVDQGWVLLKAPDLLGGYCVFNKFKNTILLIEDDEENAAVCRRMKDLGCEVLENMPPGKPVEVRPL